MRPSLVAQFIINKPNPYPVVALVIVFCLKLYLEQEVEIMKKNKLFYLERVDSDITEDSYEHGELDGTGCGLHETIGKRFGSLEDVIQYLSKIYGLSDKKDNYEIDEKNGFLQIDKQVANHSEEQNGGWMEPTAQEITSWKDGRGKLYNEHYTISFHKIATD